MAHQLRVQAIMLRASCVLSYTSCLCFHALLFWQFLDVQHSFTALVSEDKVADEFKSKLCQDFKETISQYTKAEVLNGSII